jgi:hypothetical protein
VSIVMCVCLRVCAYARYWGYDGSAAVVVVRQLVCAMCVCVYCVCACGRGLVCVCTFMRDILLIMHSPLRVASFDNSINARERTIVSTRVR